MWKVRTESAKHRIPPDFHLYAEIQAEDVLENSITRAIEILNKHGPEKGLQRVKQKYPEIAKYLETLIRRREWGDSAPSFSLYSFSVMLLLWGHDKIGFDWRTTNKEFTFLGGTDYV